MKSTMRISLVMAISLLIGLGVHSISFSAEKFNWMKYKGTNLRFIMHKIPPTKTILEMLPDFEKKTGMKVEAEVLPEEQFRQKLLIEFASGKSTVDVFLTLPANDGVKYQTSGWYEPLDKYLNDPSKTEEGYDYEDFAKSAKTGSNINNKVICMPCGFSTALLFYRRDLFEKYNVKVPDTFEELEAAAQKLTLDTDGDGKIDLYGWANRGKGRVATSTFSMFLFGYGGKFIDEKGNPVINSPEAVKALDLYGKLLRKYGPPGATNFNFYEVDSQFQQGKVAMITAGTSTFEMFQDPQKSKIPDKFDVAFVPGGPNGRHAFVVIWGFSIYSGSKNRDAAWLLTQYLTNKTAMKVLLRQAKNTGARNSTWREPDIVSLLNPKRLFDLSIETTDKYGNPNWNPPALSVTELRDALGNAIVASILGEDVKKAADKVQTEWVQILKKEREEIKK